MKKFKIILPIIILVVVAYIVFIIISGKQNDDDRLVIKRSTTELSEGNGDGTENASPMDAETSDGNQKTTESEGNFSPDNISTAGITINGEAVPEYVDEPYVQINFNEPFFTEDE